VSGNVVVTGGAGYIGSHACKALAASGFRPVAVDNLSRGHDWAVKWGPLEIGDIRDRQFLDDVFRRHAPLAVMHFAAFAYVGESVEHPALYHDNNVRGAEVLLGAVRASTCRQFIFSSSCTVYGVPGAVPIPEDHPRQPVNPYGQGKLQVEQALGEADGAWGLRSVALRYFNAAGADPDGEIGEDHDPETHVIPRALMAADSCGKFNIFGTDYPTPDGTCIRDYIHVSDLANAHVKALNYLAAGGSTDAFNLGTGRGASVREVLAAVESVTGRRIDDAVGPRRPGDPPELVAAPGRASEILGWTPRFADLSTQVAHAWSWYAAQVSPRDTSPAAR
jgi:UDP-arabinose 4-epimerase